METLTFTSHETEGIIQIFMIALVMVGSIVGNGMICLLLVRFKTLRTVPNILIAHMAVVDILNALTNMPLFIMWYISDVSYLKGLKIDLGGAAVWEYRKQYLKSFGRAFIILGHFVPFAIMLILGALIWRAVRRHKRRLYPFFPMARQVKSDVKTAKTIGLTVAAFICMVVAPMFLHFFSKIHGTWPHFLAFFLSLLNNMVNPVIYGLYTQRFRRAFLLFLREPFGKSEPGQISTSRKNVQYKNEGLNTFQITVS
ncbi:trace amine-associated receptor 13c-like isoform X2 [Pocillopora verrucosa]|uniref:trace amine-associated receptor 13c-like isoform X2 n=1 Tax=Pocillopora verrucosa TaxID=203993 RepID=UPI0033401EAB